MSSVPRHSAMFRWVTITSPLMSRCSNRHELPVARRPLEWVRWAERRDG
jgi:hypothetical protein